MAQKRNNSRKRMLTARLAARRADATARENEGSRVLSPASLPKSARKTPRTGEPAPSTQDKPQASRTPKAPAASSEATRKSMQGNKRANTKPELLVRQRLREAGLTGYRLQWKAPGRPDIAWPGKKVAIMVNGCFWHRCPHCQLSLPKSNVEYWVVKFENNVKRDQKNLALLEEEGWKVHVIWECQLKKKVIDRTFETLLPQLAEELGKELAHADH